MSRRYPLAKKRHLKQTHKNMNLNLNPWGINVKMQSKKSK